MLTEKKIAKKRPEDAELLVNLYIIFALIWSIGANINDSSRNAFDKKFKFEIETIYRNFPLEGTIYDYCIDDDMVELIPWS